MRTLARSAIRPRSLIAWSIGVAVTTLLVLSSLGVFTSTPAPKATVVTSMRTSRYGSVLVVGGSTTGPLYHFPLYEFSGDVGRHLGCGTTKVVAYDVGAKESVALTCTGPEGDLLANVSSDDWPALTTEASPVGGPGVIQRLLGTIERPGIGRQITYAGHPLYLFDPASRPFVPQGENFMETVKPLPPWHGYWRLVSSRTGAPAPGVAALEIETLPDGRRALAALEDPNVDPIMVTLYSAEVTKGATPCASVCARNWTPLLTRSTPRLGPGVDGALVGVTREADGNDEVTYEHRPLYLYDGERLRLNSKDQLISEGSAANGASEYEPGEVMSVVAQSNLP